MVRIPENAIWGRSTIDAVYKLLLAELLKLRNILYISETFDGSGRREGPTWTAFPLVLHLIDGPIMPPIQEIRNIISFNFMFLNQFILSIVFSITIELFEFWLCPCWELVMGDGESIILIGINLFDLLINLLKNALPQQELFVCHEVESLLWDMLQKFSA